MWTRARRGQPALGAAVGLLVSLTVGCFAPTFRDAQFECDETEQCPLDLICRAGRCRTSAGGGDADAGRDTQPGEDRTAADTVEGPDADPLDGSLDQVAPPDAPIGEDRALPDADPADAPPPDVPMGCLQPVDTYVVDGRAGDDAAGTGTERCPLRTITRALTLASSGTGRAGVTVMVRGSASGVAFHTAQSGEIFPLRIGSGVALVGAGAGAVVIDGTGPCSVDDVSTCAVQLEGAGASLRELTVRNADTRGHGVLISGTGADVEGVVARDCGDVGIEALGASTGTLQNVQLLANRRGLVLNGTAMLSVSDSLIEGSLESGVRIVDDSRLTSSALRVKNGGTEGVFMRDAGRWDAVGGEVRGSGGEGVRLEGAGNFGTGTVLNLDGVMLIEGGATGLRVASSAATATLHGCTVLANAGSGIVVESGGGRLNLGDAMSPGNNTLQVNDDPNLPFGPNQDVGVCNRGFRQVPAVGNVWSSCPPDGSTVGACNGGHDWAGDGIGTIDTSQCRF